MQRFRQLTFLIMMLFWGTLHAQICATDFYDIPFRNDRTYLSDDEISISVIVHILYRRGMEKTSMEDVRRQIEGLTLDYTRAHSDTSLVPEPFKGLAGNPNISFCLAQPVSSDSLSGIRYRETDITEIGLSDDYYHPTRGLEGLDARRFLNVWVCEIARDGEIAGFATFPESVGEPHDGVVIDYRYFGVDSADRYYRTLTHEVGHWLGLNHIWGSEDGCDTDDGVADTPVQKGRYHECPEYPQESCGSKDMFMNFMDLTSDTCINLFTKGQVEVMRHTLSEIRDELSCDVTAPAIYNQYLQAQVFPNPTDIKVWINLSGVVVCRVFNSSGEQMLTTKLQGNTLDVSSLSPGLYFIDITTDGNKYQAKLMVK